MYSDAAISLSRYRLEKACEFLTDAEKTLSLEMFDTAANRSYYVIFHTMRALFALDGKDFKKHSGVISAFQKEYIKPGIFSAELSDIVKSAFSLRHDSDYEDFYVVPREDVVKQVQEARLFYKTVKAYIETKLQSDS